MVEVYPGDAGAAPDGDVRQPLGGSQQGGRQVSVLHRESLPPQPGDLAVGQKVGLRSGVGEHREAKDGRGVRRFEVIEQP